MKLLIGSLFLISSFAFAGQWASVKDLKQKHVHGTEEICKAAKTTEGNDCIRLDMVDWDHEVKPVWTIRGTKLKLVSRKKK